MNRNESNLGTIVAACVGVGCAVVAAIVLIAVNFPSHGDSPAKASWDAGPKTYKDAVELVDIESKRLAVSLAAYQEELDKANSADRRFFGNSPSADQSISIEQSRSKGWHSPEALEHLKAAEEIKRQGAAQLLRLERAKERRDALDH